MRIFYAVQATGNGHISRAMELLPYLQTIGSVDIFLSGDNANLRLDAPVRYRSKGISLHYNCRGGLDYWRILRGFHPLQLRREIRDLPVEQYDLVLNDFEYITAAACQRKQVPFIHFGHQASFMSPKTPRPERRNATGEWILKNYARSTQQVGFHFEAYDQDIFGAVVKRQILDANPVDKGHITVYLPSYCQPQLKALFFSLRDCRFEIFTKEITAIQQEGHIRWMPVNKELFNESLITCNGIITGGGFETPAEAMHLGKKILSIPIRGQYEQQCNAAALQQLGVTTLDCISAGFRDELTRWLHDGPVVQKDYSNTIVPALERILALAAVAEPA